MAVQKIIYSGVPISDGTIDTPHDYLCESTDVKPTEDIVLGSTIWELDTKKGFIFDGANWREV